MALILLQEFLTTHTEGFGQTQQLTFVLNQTLVDVVKLFDELFDTVLVQRQRLHCLDELILQFLVATFLARRQFARRGQTALDLLILQLAQLLVGIGDEVERFHDLRTQFGFHGRQRQVGFVFVLFLFFRGHVAADIGNVVVVTAALRLVVTRLFLFHALDHRSLLGFRTGIGGFEVDNFAQQNVGIVQLVTPDDDRLEGQRAFAKPGDHGLATSLDALCNRDFAFARQKLDGPHFAQIHAHRIVGTVGRLFLGRGGGNSRTAGFDQIAALFRVVVVVFFAVVVLLVIFNDVDAHIGKHRHRVFDLLGCHFLGRQHGVQLVHGDVAALLREFDHLLDSIVRKVEKRTVGSTFALDFGFFVFLNLRCHMFFSRRPRSLLRYIEFSDSFARSQSVS